MGFDANESREHEGKEERRKRKKGGRFGLVDFFCFLGEHFSGAVLKIESTTGTNGPHE